MEKDNRLSIPRLAAALLTIGVFLMPTVATGTASPLLTTALIPASATETTLAGYQGVEITYQNSLSNSFIAFVYLAVSNSAGQTVAVYYATTTTASTNQSSPAFVIISGLPTGTYNGTLFAATSDGIPVSTLTKVAITL